MEGNVSVKRKRECFQSVNIASAVTRGLETWTLTTTMELRSTQRTVKRRLRRLMLGDGERKTWSGARARERETSEWRLMGTESTGRATAPRGGSLTPCDGSLTPCGPSRISLRGSLGGGEDRGGSGPSVGGEGAERGDSRLVGGAALGGKSHARAPTPAGPQNATLEPAASRRLGRGRAPCGRRDHKRPLSRSRREEKKAVPVMVMMVVVSTRRDTQAEGGNDPRLDETVGESINAVHPARAPRGVPGRKPSRRPSEAFGGRGREVSLLTADVLARLAEHRPEGGENAVGLLQPRERPARGQCRSRVSRRCASYSPCPGTRNRTQGLLYTRNTANLRCTHG
ncbi:unnamed protein product [Lampetra fluviatilis]